MKIEKILNKLNKINDNLTKIINSTDITESKVELGFNMANISNIAEKSQKKIQRLIISVGEVKENKNKVAFSGKIETGSNSILIGKNAGKNF